MAITDHDRNAILQAVNDRMNGFRFDRDWKELIRKETDKVLSEAGVPRKNFDMLMTKKHLWEMTRDEWWIDLAKVLNYKFLPSKNESK